MKHVVWIVCVLAFLVALVGAMPLARADSGSGTRTYLIATGFLCGLAPSECPAIAMADNGDTVELTGGGTFGIHPKMATGGGPFVHKSAAGTTLATGTWEATALLTFTSYGLGTGGLAGTEGGKVQMKVNLLVGGVVVHTAVLTVICLIGSAPAGAMEGVKLAVQDALNFNMQVQGFTVYMPT